jgi:hypothetical protein
MTRIVVNPGTGGVEGATVEQAEKNIAEFVGDLKKAHRYLQSLTATRKPENDGGGRFGFRLVCDWGACDVDMPGCGMERLVDHDPWNCHRLYVNGSSWLWGYACGIARSKLTGDAD